MEQSDLDLLHTIPPYHLQALTKLIHLSASLKGQAGTSSTSVADVAEQLFQPVRISEALQELNELETTMLRELVSCGGRANSRDLALYLSNSGLLSQGKGEGADPDVHYTSTPGVPLQYPAPHPHGVFEQALRHLLVLGLVFWGKQTNFAGRDYASGVYDGVLIVPKAIIEVARGGWKPEAQELDTRSLAEYERIRTFQRTLYLYWSLVAEQREGLSVVSNGLLSRAALRQVIEALQPKFQLEQLRTEQELPFFLFVRLLMIKLGLLQERHGAIYAAPPEVFFSLSLLERTRRCYQIWVGTPFWNELPYLPGVSVRPGPGPIDPPHEELVKSRQVLVERVFQEPAGEWRDFSAFIARTKLHIPYLLFPRRYGSRTERYTVGNNPYDWDFRLQRGWLTHREGWHLVEGGFIRAVVAGPLFWLGLVELNNEENPTAFRLASGSSLVIAEMNPENEQVTWGRLIVQPNFELVALAPVSEALLINLDRFAERVRLEHIAQYRLTKASVTRAVQMGLRAETIQQTLAQAAGSEIPQNIQYSLVEWERQARRIELWSNATLLEVDSASLLDALFADEQVQPLLVRRLTPVLAQVDTRSLAAVQQALWGQNLVPVLSAALAHEHLLQTGQFVTREAQWRLLPGGQLQPCYAVRDLYLAAELERITEPDEASGWRCLTPKSVQQGLSAGFSLDHIISFLQHYCEGGVPASFLIRLKLWGGGYGEHATVQVEDAPLLRISASILQDLQADEALKPLLGSELPQQARLVRVPREHIARVLELLRERGFEIE